MLLISPKPQSSAAISDFFRQKNWIVLEYSTIADAFFQVASFDPDIFMMYNNISPALRGIDLVPRIKKIKNKICIVLIAEEREIIPENQAELLIRLPKNPEEFFNQVDRLIIQSYQSS